MTKIIYNFQLDTLRIIDLSKPDKFHEYLDGSAKKPKWKISAFKNKEFNLFLTKGYKVIGVLK
jgi:hypothetical protein